MDREDDAEENREYDYEEGEEVPQTKIVLVNERDLEGACKGPIRVSGS